MSNGVKRVAVGVATAAVAILGLAAPVAMAAKKPARPRLSIAVLSGRADLVSGGSTLVAITLPNRAAARHIKVTLGHRKVTRAFAFRKDGRFEALLTGLKLGPNILQAKLASGWAARITLVNHPLGGPIVSGPQLQPWACQAGATDKQCDQPATFTYLYKSTNPAATGLTAYDPAHPASDVAQTTTDQGVRVPFIVRVETGYMDRDQYQIAALDQPGKPWTAVAPQAQFDHKLLITHGASCAVDYTTGAAPGTTGTATDQTALGKGFIVMSTALDNSGHNCNLALQAESLVMAKEHVIKAYGTLRYTIGLDAPAGRWPSSGSPTPTRASTRHPAHVLVPHAYSTATQFLDYHLLLAYFTHPTKWATGVVCCRRR